MSGVELACRYSFKPNYLGLCGPKNNLDLFNHVTTRKPNEGKMKKLLSRFEAAFPYYRLIAKANQIKDYFDYSVVEAYWIGNDLLKKVKDNDIKQMILSDFGKPGLLNKKMASFLANKLPKGIKPHHSFHVIYMGSITGVVPKNINTFNKCFVSWGQIKKVVDKNLMVKLPKLIKVKQKIIIRGWQDKQILYRINNKSFIKNPRVGDYVSVHWRWTCDRLGAKQLRHLQYWTNHTLTQITPA